MATIEALTVHGTFDTNCYFIVDEQTGHALLVDPGAEADRLLEIIGKNSWIVEKILLTHGHFDHTGAVDRISAVLDVPYFIHKRGVAYLGDPALNLSAATEMPSVLPNAKVFGDGELIALKANPDVSLRVVHVPGHTPDSCLFYSKKDSVAFVGDTIFRGSIGTDRFPGGDKNKLLRSIREKVFTLPDETVLLSGHSASTTVSIEKRRYGL